MNVKINKPKDQLAFLASLDEVKTSKQKAVSMLFEEIEQEVMEKDRFITQQLEKLKEMNESYQTMQDYLQVLASVRLVVPSIRSGAAFRSMHGGINMGGDSDYGYSFSDHLLTIGII